MLLNNFLYKKSILSNQNKIIYDSLSSLIPKSDIYSFEESHLNSGKKKMEIKKIKTKENDLKMMRIEDIDMVEIPELAGEEEIEEENKVEEKEIEEENKVEEKEIEEENKVEEKDIIVLKKVEEEKKS